MCTENKKRAVLLFKALAWLAYLFYKIDQIKCLNLLRVETMNDMPKNMQLTRVGLPVITFTARCCAGRSYATLSRPSFRQSVTLV